MSPSDAESPLTSQGFAAALQQVGQPVASTQELANVLDRPSSRVAEDLTSLADSGAIGRRGRGDQALWYPVEWIDRLDREHIICFPDERELVLSNPRQYTRALCNQFAELVATNGTGAYRYRIRPIDLWYGPYTELEELLSTMQSVIGELPVRLEEWVTDQFNRARQFRLESHPDGYTLLVASTPELMGNVAREVLDEDSLHAPVSETESWVVEGSEATIKRRLFEEGFPVADERDLDPGAELSIDIDFSLRPYQEDWIESFLEEKSGVIVGPPGSGKTLAAIAIMARIGGECLIVVPNRELATQWREVILEETTVGQEAVGEYHGGEKQLRPVTIATYHIAAMERHRQLFEERRWGLIVFDEVQHIPASVYRRAADLQGRYRLGLSASPVREDDREAEIFTVIGPPIGTDWGALIEAGHVLEPRLEIRYVPWASGADRQTYDLAEGHAKRQLAAQNPQKREEIRRLLEAHAEEPVLIFVEWLEQGQEYAEAFDLPFISGETPHPMRERHFEAFREGQQGTLIVSRVGDEGLDLPAASVAILASGLGGSRRQGTQRVGRTMRPSGGAEVYVLATRGTVEEDFASRQLQYLQARGIRVTERTLSPGENDE